MKQDEEERKGYDERWAVLNKKLKKSTPTYEEPEFPFAPGVLIRDYNSLYSKIYDKEKYVNM